MCTIRVTPEDKLQAGTQTVKSMRRPSFGADDTKLYTRAISGGMMRIQNRTGYATSGRSCLNATLF